MSLKNWIRNIFPQKLIHFLAYQLGDEYASKCYAQEGEDILLKRIFDNSPPGFFIDVGAHHPFRFSNTKLLYDLGWTGINIEANPSAIEIFNTIRKKDITISAGISEYGERLTYHEYHHPALNTFDKNLVASRIKKPVSTQLIDTYKLSEILEKHLPKSQKINVLTIDVEGLDLQVLKSNDWNKYKPDWIIIELPTLPISEVLNHPTNKYLTDLDYQLFSKLSKSCFYKLC